MVSIAITAFILLAKWKYKFPEYDPTAESADLDSEQAPVITESET